MSDLTDRDWELVSAYHDGELAPEAARGIEARLAAEPALAAALAGVCEVSASLCAMRPLPAQPPAAATPPALRATANRRPLTWLAAGAIAAGLLVAVVVGTGQFAPETPLDAHLELAGQPFAVDRTDVATIAASASDDWPDLSAANLVSVTRRAFGDGTVAHYAGRNGCRLSYFRGTAALPGTAVRDAQSAVWATADGLRHGIIATGMDTEKFAAISAYLQAVTRREAASGMYAALETATEAATPCVG
ncbi:hypothetical protein GE300_02365 [Rhodobacteraceae bacterium 2CG4]|uniref:Anti-sigma factor RsiW n=1 Tax=Halovulum marinum TaxID=2662447 RepID=A0A6L5YWV8_9RHOB|nr:hypothetical protein [Halovulum marinum]MSU88460.1 hypothetical protein [Halovulum marinum]